MDRKRSDKKSKRPNHFLLIFCFGIKYASCPTDQGLLWKAAFQKFLLIMFFAKNWPKSNFTITASARDILSYILGFYPLEKNTPLTDTPWGVYTSNYGTKRENNKAA